MKSRRFFFHKSFLAAVLVFSFATASAFADIFVFHDSTGKTELVDTENPGAHAMPAGPWETYGKAGGIQFNVSYEDVTLNNNIGFDDATNGAARRARVGEIFTYLNTVLDHTGVCDVVFTASDNAGGGGGGGTLATGGSYYSLSPDFTNGIAFQHITTGVDPTDVFPDIHVVVHFGWPWYQGTGTPSFSQIDLKSVLLHEVTHGLGLMTLANSDGTSSMSADGGFNTYAKWDDLLETGNSKKLFGGNPPVFLGVANDLLGLDNGVRFTGATAMSIYGSKPPIYAPDPWQVGSSIAHWPRDLAGPPVMEWAFGNGEVVREYAPFEIGALQDIGYVVVLPSGEGEGEGEAFTADVDVNGTGVGPGYLEGSTLQLTATPSGAVCDPPGSGCVEYLWYRNGLEIGGATDAVLDFGHPLTAADNGVYTCRLTDQSKGTSWTAPVYVTVVTEEDVPVAGLLGLGLLVGVFAAGGRFVIRKRK